MTTSYVSSPKFSVISLCEEVVDAKSVSFYSLKSPTGNQLLWLLAILLGGLTLIFTQFAIQVSSFEGLFPLALSSIASGLLGYVVLKLILKKQELPPWGVFFLFL
jgi:hypothetical protein